MAAHVSDWPDEVEAILDADNVVALANVTPARGVVVAPVNNFALRDRDAGRIAVNSSVGAWRKLERMRRNPRVALALHTREHSSSERTEYVLVQGTASFAWPPDRDSWMDEVGRERWDRWSPTPRDVGPLWEWWMSVYHWRVNIWIQVERVVVWPDLRCRGVPAVHGAPLPGDAPAPQKAPKGGTGPRVSQARAARRAGRLPHTLLGWVGTDGYPMVVPVEAAGTTERGLRLDSPVALPPGGRRAGLTSHRFAPRALGQEQHIHTGWLDADEGTYAPHTHTGYSFPASRLLYKAVTGGATRMRLRRARRAGVLPG
jgi:nitroimidazol reductase NimA-like FMN-containing flavoprotein (pyridoxamine 5'-phosphate oxidase superfamily)